MNMVWSSTKKMDYTILLYFVVMKKSVPCFVGNSEDVQPSDMIQ